ncbi:MAG: antibiotic biosynthesis monooxygenase [Acidimicrobiales bacterium]|nr:antibiotic biosynthesis monooxygenase [Acidimicrobiales bacterium]
MIVVAGHMTIDPAQRETALAAIAAGVDATRAEPGNLDYRFSPDLDDPNRFNLIELWESEEAMTEHMATPHLAAFMTAIVPCVSGSAEVIRYDVSASAPLF